MRKILFSAIIVFMQIALFAQFPESFEGSVFPPTGWRVFDNDNGTEQSWRRSEPAYMGQQAAFIRWENVPDGQAEDWLVTPRFTPTQQAHILSFYEKDNYAIDYASVYTVRVSTASANNPADFVVLDQQNELDLGLSYKYHEVDLSDYIGQQIYIAFVMSNDDGDDWMIDEIHLAPCSRPQNIEILELFADGAVLSWEDEQSNAWDIDIVESGQTPSGVPAFSAIQNPFTWTGGQALTHYDVYLRANCSANTKSNWFGPFSFYTACSNSSCDYKLVLADSYGDDWNGASIEVIQDGVSMGYFTQHEAGFGPYEYTVSLCDSMEFELVWHAGNWDSECIFSFRDDYDQEYFSFTAGNFPQNNEIFFKGKTDCSPVTCRFPSQLTASASTESGAQLSWTEKDNATRWDIEFVAEGQEPSGIPTVYNIEQNPYTWTGGQSGTYYRAFVRSSCNDQDHSRWSQPTIFATRCTETVGVFPYTESFTSEYPLPICWISETKSATSGMWQTSLDNYSEEPIVYCKHENEQQDVWLISPPLDFSDINTEITLSFDWKMSYYWMVYPYDKGDLSVKISTDKGESWSQAVWSEKEAGFFESFEWENTRIDLTEYTGYPSVWIAFQYKAKDAATVYLDNFSIEDGSGGITSVIENEKQKFRVYPNPFRDRFEIIFSSDQAASGLLNISDLNGRLIAVQPVEIHEGVNQISVHNIDLEPGMYLLSMDMPGGVLTQKMIRL